MQQHYCTAAVPHQGFSPLSSSCSSSTYEYRPVLLYQYQYQGVGGAGMMLVALDEDGADCPVELAEMSAVERSLSRNQCAHRKLERTDCCVCCGGGKGQASGFGLRAGDLPVL